MKQTIFKHKHAVIEVQLNWIFILIVGAVILLFFVFVGKNIVSSSEIKTSQKIINNFGAILSGSSTSSSLATKLNIPKTEMIFTCSADDDACSENYGCTSTFEYAKTGKTMDVSSTVVFSPVSINTNTLLIWTQDWLLPFKIMNFIYLSREDIKYILVASSDDLLANEIEKLMIDNEFIEVVRTDNPSTLTIDQNDYWIRLVYFDSEPPASVNKINAEHVDAIIINQEAKTVTFKELNGKKINPTYHNKLLPYLDTASLLGAIFSESPEQYVCNMNKALFRYGKVYGLLEKRTALLKQTLPVDSSCGYFYSIPFKPITNPALLNDGMVSTIQSMATELETQNRNAIINSCPRLY